MKHSSLLVSVVVLYAFLTQSVLAATYYVDAVNGTDGQDATNWATARETISNADDLLAPGDTLKIRGFYGPGEIPDPPTSGTNGAWITYEGVYSEDTGSLPFFHGATELDESDFALYGGSTNTYVANNPYGSTIDAMWTAPPGTALGDSENWTWLTKVGDIASVETTTGSWFYVASDKFYVHTPDSSHPTNYDIIYPSNNRNIYLTKDYIAFTGLIMNYYRGTGIGLYSGAGNCRIYGNTFGPRAELTASAGHDVEISSNIFERTSIMVKDDFSNAVIRANTISGVPGNAMTVVPTGDIEVYDNTVYSNRNGIYIYKEHDQLDFYNNLVYGNDEYGMQLLLGYSWGDTVIYNNTVYDNGCNMLLDRGNNKSSGALWVFNNTLYNSTGYDVAGNGWVTNCLHIRRHYEPQNLDLFNNIIWQGGTGAHAIYNETRSVNSDYNNLYVTDGANVGYWGSSATLCTDLAAWQAAGGGANSISTDPGFVDLLSSPKDLHITAASPCFNSGTDQFSGYATVDAPSTDIDGDVRPIMPDYDMGSDEYMPPRGTSIIVR